MIGARPVGHMHVAPRPWVDSDGYREPRKSGTCASPGCKVRVRGERKFCKRCQDRLDRVKEQMKRDTFMRKTKGARMNPRCCWPGCDEDRAPGETYCHKGAEGH